MKSSEDKKSEEGEVLEKNTQSSTENGKGKIIKEAQELDPDSQKCINEAKTNPGKIIAEITNGNSEHIKKEDATTDKSENIKPLKIIIDGADLESIKEIAKIPTESSEVLVKICEDTGNGKTIEKNDPTLKLYEEKTSTTEETDEEEVEYFKFVTDKDLPISFIQKRHTDIISGLNNKFTKWRLDDDVKTVCIVIVLCLKFDITPGDIIKTNPCAKLECWRDPTVVSPKQAIIQIGSRLEKQYERLQVKSVKYSDDIIQKRTNYHQCLDPNDSELKEMCLSLRKRSKEERILLHYNGHGVIIPSELGEFFVYNKDYTKYMPLSVWDLIDWIKPPIVFVFDCAEAEKLVKNFEQYRKRNQHLYEVDLESGIIQLAACSISETLPMRPDLPADVFTSCLTTPVKMAMHWHVVVNRCRLVQNVDLNLIEKIPGRLNDRRTMLGELYWIFVAITDTIAWNTVPRALFHKLYRQDEILASLFRNYLLAERIMQAHNRTTVTYPKLPRTFKHHLWNTWDYILEQFLTQLHDVIKFKKPYENSTFFSDQLIAFEIWLRFASEEKGEPEQLPILIQVLLNETYRLRALELLVKFVDLGPWAVNLTLSVGIFPYMVQLLNKKTKELQEPLVFIWAKILAVDNSCLIDLILDNNCKYFLSIVKDHSVAPIYRTLAAFVLATVVNDFGIGQYAALGNSLITICLEELSDNNPQLKQWVAICLARVWDKYSKARWAGVRDNAHVKLYPLLQDPCPEVRAAAVYALGTFIHSVHNLTEHADNINQSIAITLVDKVCHDMNPLVRQELIAALQWIVLTYEYKFINLATQENSLNINQDYSPLKMLKRSGSSLLPLNANNFNLDLDSPRNLRRTASISCISNVGSPISPPLRYSPFNVKTWAALCSLEADAHPKVAQMGAIVTNHIRSQINRSIDFRKRTNTGFSSSSSNKDKSESEAIQKPLVTTEFVCWAHKLIALPLLKTNKPEDDPESELNCDREWRLQRNINVRTKAHEEYKRAFNCTTYTQIYSKTLDITPSLLQFHPYEQQIAVADQHSFTICNLDQKRSSKQLKILNSTKKITALEWVNSHDDALLMSGFDDGTVELWRYNNDPILISAWRVYNELTPPGKLTLANVLLTWEQWTQTVIAAGSGRIIRLWDVEQELHAFDIPTGSKHPVTCLDSTYSSRDHKHYMVVTSNALKQSLEQKHGLIAAGFADGSIRLYDRRSRPRDAQIMTSMDHMSNILAMHLHHDYIISGCVNGYVKIYDIRSKGVTDTHFQPQMENLSAFCIHRNSQIYAWGSRDRYVNICNMFGDNLNVIRFQEGNLFNTRIGAVNCLAFHPHRVLLAAGTDDSSVLIHSIV